jgi:hypothetical protein
LSRFSMLEFCLDISDPNRQNRRMHSEATRVRQSGFSKWKSTLEVEP